MIATRKNMKPALRGASTLHATDASLSGDVAICCFMFKAHRHPNRSSDRIFVDDAHSHLEQQIATSGGGSSLIEGGFSGAPRNAGYFL
jgi:hypothetical protein